MVNNCPNHYTCIGCKHAQLIETIIEPNNTHLLVKVQFSCPLCSITNIETSYILS